MLSVRLYASQKQPPDVPKSDREVATDKLVREANAAADEALEVSQRLRRATKLYGERLQGDKKK